MASHLHALPDKLRGSLRKPRLGAHDFVSRTNSNGVGRLKQGEEKGQANRRACIVVSCVTVSITISIIASYEQCHGQPRPPL